MRYLIFFLLFAPFFFGFTHNNQRLIRVALVDTGLNVDDFRFKDKICPEVGEDFTGEGLNDTHGHGTHVAGLIKQYSGNKNYCFIILKYYSDKASTDENSRQYMAALDKLNEYNPDVVNMSLSGPTPMMSGKSVIANLPTTRFFVAAGNEGQDLDKTCNSFPACYAKELTNITVVGNKNATTSNYGSVVNLWIDGNNIESTYPYSLEPSGRAKLSGTSMSTAIATGEFIHEHY